MINEDEEISDHLKRIRKNAQEVVFNPYEEPPKASRGRPKKGPEDIFTPVPIDPNGRRWYKAKDFAIRTGLSTKEILARARLITYRVQLVKNAMAIHLNDEEYAKFINMIDNPGQ